MLNRDDKVDRIGNEIFRGYVKWKRTLFIFCGVQYKIMH